MINPDGPIQNKYRFPNECVRHKIVDLIGDLRPGSIELGLLREGGEPRVARSETGQPFNTGRADIVDRNGEELAMSIPAYSISVNPKLVVDEAGTARVLQSVIGLDDVEAAELYEALVATNFIFYLDGCDSLGRFDRDLDFNTCLTIDRDAWFSVVQDIALVTGRPSTTQL